MLENRLHAFAEWRRLLGSQWVSETGGGGAGYIVPANQQEVIEALTIARQHRISLYSVSRGMNWGYGGFVPTHKDSVVLDLSRLTRIVSFNSQLGLVCVEPGVTMGQLSGFLQERNAIFVAPYVGVGASASIVGNLLEKGRSSVAHVDRLSSLVSLRVLLADGSIYESPSSFFKWGVGPYLDGLFVQSNMGIVLEATVSLAPKPIYTKGFFISLRKNASLEDVVTVVCECQQLLGSLLTSVSIQNKARILSRNSIMQKDNAQYGDWLVLGVLAGEPSVVKAGSLFIKKKFKQLATQQILFTNKKLKIIRGLNKFFSSWQPLKIQRLESMFQTALEIAGGEGKGAMFLDNKKIDQKGLLFVPIVLPFTGEVVAKCTTEIEMLCKTYGISCEIAYLNFTSNSLLLSFLIVFDSNDLDATHNARAFYREVVSVAVSLGGLLYRGAVDTMPHIYDPDKVFWKLAQHIKKILDPQDLISPGRYIPSQHE